MADFDLAAALTERAICEAEHTAARVPHNGFGWTGTRCPRCGFMFFGEWEAGFIPEQNGA